MEQKLALAERLKQANNILVTVSSNPTVDQLAACIGMTLALNKLEKHATAVFSGAIPNIIEFLEPEKTLEKNTDSLRDFIIALDKSKADKLRYKVEDTVVKIFITPYRTSINEKDLQFSQGDFNVDVVLALGVHDQADLDQAITAHGRILHDATVATVNVEPGGELGTVNWLDHDASSLSELCAELTDAIDKEVMDTQIATAFLTGIVAETNRFSNDKTSPMTMTISAELMAAGANQQLVATKLEPPKPAEPKPVDDQHTDDHDDEHHGDDQAPPAEPPKPDDGTLEISHTDDPKPAPSDDHDEEHHDDADNPDAGNDDEHHDDQPQEQTEEAQPAEVHHEDREDHHETDDSTQPKADHQQEPVHESIPELEKPAVAAPTDVPQIKIDEQGSLQMHDGLPAAEPKPEIHLEKQHMILEPPTLSTSAINGDILPEDDERPAGAPPLSSISQPGLLQRGSSTAAASFPSVPPPFIAPSQPPVAPQQPASNPFTTAQPSTPPAPLPPQSAPAVVMSPVVPQATSPAQPVFQPAPLARPAPVTIPAPPASAPVSLPPLPQPPAAPTQTLSQIEQNVNSPHLQQFMAAPNAPAAPQPSAPPIAPVSAPVSPPPATPPFFPPYDPTTVGPATPQPPKDGENVASARDAVMNAYDGSEQSREPIEALNAQPLGEPLHENNQHNDPNAPPSLPPPIAPPSPAA